MQILIGTPPELGPPFICPIRGASSTRNWGRGTLNGGCRRGQGRQTPTSPTSTSTSRRSWSWCLLCPVASC